MTTSNQAGTATPGPYEAARSGTDPKWWTLAAVCLGTFMLLLDITIVNVALPDIQSSLGASFSDLQWVIDAYALTLAALLLTTGSLADLYGRRRLYLAGLIIFTAASALCGAAQSPLMLELSRGLQGVGGAAMFSVSLALLANAFRGKDRGVAFGIWGALTGVAVAIGPIVGGALVTGASWRWIFYVNLPVGIIALALTILRVAESRDEHAARPDWPGFVLFSAALACLVYALIEAGRTSFTATLVLACFAIAAFGISAGIFSVLLFLVLYLQDVLGYSALQTGLRLLILSGAILVVSGIAGRLSSKVPVRMLIGPGLVLAGVGLLLMRGLTAASTWTHLIPGLIVAGVGVGFINPPLASTAVGVVAPRRAGMASGINSTFRQVGIATGIALLGALFASRLNSAVAALSAAIATALHNGSVHRVFAATPPHQRGLLAGIVTGSFTTALNEILLVAAIISFASGVLAFVLIRSKDFVSQAQPEHAAVPSGQPAQSHHRPAAVAGAEPAHRDER